MLPTASHVHSCHLLLANCHVHQVADEKDQYYAKLVSELEAMVGATVEAEAEAPPPPRVVHVGFSAAETEAAIAQVWVRDDIAVLWYYTTVK